MPSVHLNKFKNNRIFWKNVREHRKILRKLNLRSLEAATSHNLNEVTIPNNLNEVETDGHIMDKDTNSIRENWILELECEDKPPNESTSGQIIEHNKDLQAELRRWALEHNIRQSALKDFLCTFKPFFPDSDLPNDPRTLLKTPQEVKLQPMDNGFYWHQGLDFCLRQFFQSLREDINISLNFNVDGLPIYKSSPIQFWPILFNIHELKEFKPMVIGIYCGKGKPSNVSNYLRQFVDECNQILQNPILIDNHTINISIRSFICDSPARAFIKGVTYFNGKHGCLKCTVVGEYINHVTVFLRTNCAKRTDQDFRNKLYGLHHKNTSLIEMLPIDMVEDFPIGDALHLIDLGIVKKCLTGWTHGDYKGTGIKFSAKDIQDISFHLIHFKVPREIHRATRGLDCLAFWKGTEYRTFLFYLVAVFLKDYLRYDAYEHFLCFFCAITICSSDVFKHFLVLARQLLEYYIEKYMELYKKHSITSNVHNLCHLVDEVEKFGSLPSFSAYPFENMLFSLKNLLRTGSNPLAQAAKRISEQSQLEKFEKNLPNYPILKNKNKYGTYNTIIFENFTLSSEVQNKWFLSKNKQIIKFENTFLKNDKIFINGFPIKIKNDFFNTPIKSSFLNIFFSNCEVNDLCTFEISSIECKLVVVPYKNDKTVFIPLIHTYSIN